MLIYFETCQKSILLVEGHSLLTIVLPQHERLRFEQMPGHYRDLRFHLSQCSRKPMTAKRPMIAKFAMWIVFVPEKSLRMKKRDHMFLSELAPIWLWVNSSCSTCPLIVDSARNFLRKFLSDVCPRTRMPPIFQRVWNGSYNSLVAQSVWPVFRVYPTRQNLKHL